MNAQMTAYHVPVRTRRVTLYPNLVTDKRFWLQLYNVETGPVYLHLYTLSGNTVLKNLLYHAGYHSMHTITIPRHIQRGIYKITVRCRDHDFTQPIIIL